MLRVLAISLALSLAAATASAADHGIYLGAAVSQSKVDFDNNASRFNGNDTKFKVIAGVRALNWLAAEVNYVDFGTVTGPVTPATNGEYRLKGFDGFAVGLWEIGLVDFYAKGGVVRFDRSIRINNINIPNSDDTGFEPAYGGGIQVHVGSLSVRGEYEKFDIGSDTKVDLISVGVTWTFL